MEKLAGIGEGSATLDEGTHLDPFLRRLCRAEYNGVPVFVSGATPRTGFESRCSESRLRCLLYTDGERDYSRTQYRYLKGDKARCRPCAGFYDLTKDCGGPWICLKKMEHTCQRYRSSGALDGSSPVVAEGSGSTEEEKPFEGDGGTDGMEPMGADEGVESPSPESARAEQAEGKGKKEKEVPPSSRSLRPRTMKAKSEVIYERPPRRFRRVLGENRPAVEISSLPLGVADRFREVVRPKLESFKNWVNITGGSKKRAYIPNLDDGKGSHQPIAELLERETKWVRDFIQDKYPALQYYKLGAIRSEACAPSQYVGHRHRLHSDYDSFVNDRAAEERPVSFMVALDRFQLIHSRPDRDGNEELVTRWVEAGDLVVFTNNLMHSGGENPEGHSVYRVFGYMVSDPADFPGTHVFFPVDEDTNSV